MNVNLVILSIFYINNPSTLHMGGASVLYSQISDKWIHERDPNLVSTYLNNFI